MSLVRLNYADTKHSSRQRHELAFYKYCVDFYVGNNCFKIRNFLTLNLCQINTLTIIFVSIIAYHFVILHPTVISK